MKLLQLLARFGNAYGRYTLPTISALVLAAYLYGHFFSPQARQTKYDQELELSYQAQLKALDQRRQRDSAAAYERGRLDQLKRSEASARTDYETHLRARPTTGPLQLPDFSARPGPAPAGPAPAAR